MPVIGSPPGGKVCLGKRAAFHLQLLPPIGFSRPSLQTIRDLYLVSWSINFTLNGHWWDRAGAEGPSFRETFLRAIFIKPLYNSHSSSLLKELAPSQKLFWRPSPSTAYKMVMNTGITLSLFGLPASLARWWRWLWQRSIAGVNLPTSHVMILKLQCLPSSHAVLCQFHL